MIKIYYAEINKNYSYDFALYLLSLRFGAEFSSESILKKGLGKPYIPNCPVSFNISHSENIVAVAFCKNEIGFDIQTIKPNAYKKLKERFFGNTPASDFEFVTLWTAAEAFVKYNASSIVTDLKKIEIKPDGIFYEGVKQNVNLSSGKAENFVFSCVTGQAETFCIEKDCGFTKSEFYRD